ncbi:MAG: hypothetical protein RIF39_02790, partial [Cyclobacteriaceae bacterium]
MRPNKVQNWSVKKPFITALSIILLHFCFEGNAQKQPKKLKNAGVVALDDSLTAFSQSDIFDFPNINTERFYVNNKGLQEIQRYDNAGVDEKLYLALKNYVRNFGVENFST